MADLARRSQSPREVYFSEVVDSDPVKLLIWAKDFGDVAIPLVAFQYAFAYYDTVPVGDAHDGEPIATSLLRRDDKTHRNKNFLTSVVCPSKGDLAVVLDPWGAKRFPICIGTLASTDGAWEEDLLAG